MRRKFCTAAQKVGRYMSVLDKNKALWLKIFPCKTGPSLDFYQGEKVDQTALDYSLNIMWDMLERKGKKIRPILMMILADMYSISHTVALPMSFFVETVHNATLIIDDIEDNSQNRRGEPCSHLKFGIDNSINAGALAFFLPAHNLVRHLEEIGLDKGKTALLLKLYIEEMKNLHLGLAWDIRWHGQKFALDELPTEDNYLKMVESKTSVLLRIGFKLIAEMATIEGEEKKKIATMADLIGKSFQIQDDIINLRSLDYSKGRGVSLGEDITEGKITLMVIEHIKRTRDNWLLELLSSKTKDQVLIDKCIARMEDSGAIQYADQVQRRLMSEAIAVLDQLNANGSYKADMRTILFDLLERKT